MLLENKNAVIYWAGHRRRGWRSPMAQTHERLLKPR